MITNAHWKPIEGKWYSSRAGRLLPADRGVLAQSQIDFAAPRRFRVSARRSIAGALIWQVVAHNLLRSGKESRLARKNRKRNALNACNQRNQEQDPRSPRGIRSWKNWKAMILMRKPGT